MLHPRMRYQCLFWRTQPASMLLHESRLRDGGSTQNFSNCILHHTTFWCRYCLCVLTIIAHKCVCVHCASCWHIPTVKWQNIRTRGGKSSLKIFISKFGLVFWLRSGIFAVGFHYSIFTTAGLVAPYLSCGFSFYSQSVQCSDLPAVWDVDSLELFCMSVSRAVAY